MNNRIFQRLCTLIMSLALLSVGMPVVSYAGIVDTATYVEAGQRDADLATISAQLNRADVRERLEGMGVDRAQVDTRLAAMTDSEIRQLAARMDQMPKGGDLLAVIGVVFVVLLILELVGVIDIFKKTP
jgi:hypothetical protein